MFNEGIKTFKAGEALEARRRVKIKAGTLTTPPEVEYADAGEDYVGVTEYAVANGDPVACRLNTFPGTFEVECTVGAAIARGTVLYGANDGKVSDTSSGTAQGISLEAGATGQHIEMAPWNVKATTAATVSIADAGNFTATATVEAALQEIYQSMVSVQATLQPAALRLESGAAIAAFANAGADGWNQVSNKDTLLRWNDGATPTDFVADFIMPQDLDDAADIVVHLLGAIVKAGGAEADSPVVTVEAYFSSVGAAPAAAADVGGSSGEFLTAATNTYQEKTLTITAANVPVAPCALTLVFHPADGELGTDDFVMFPPWIEYKRKIMTS